MHKILTGGTDQKSRALLVEHSISAGDNVLDAGAGTGNTALLAAARAGEDGRITLLDISEKALERAKDKAKAAGIVERLDFLLGDMQKLPFDDDYFDAALSTYSLEPLEDPVAGALEMYRVIRPGGLLGVAHTTEPKNGILKSLSHAIDRAAWNFPTISLGCLPVAVLPDLLAVGAKLMFSQMTGTPLWPFQVFVVAKPRRKTE